MKKKYIIILIVSTLWITVPIICDVTIMIANNCVALRVKHDIEEIPLPPKTEQIESLSSARKLIGNGNGMQYFGAVLLQSELSFEELDTYYSKYRKAEWYYAVEKQTSKTISETNNQLSFKTDINGDNYYIVYSWGGTKYKFLYEWDIRGH